ncbi:calmodulin, putative [Talaromyces stipitatus ATCC 10500]|uniref:Calmodulin, putative n=1 Tax=Talaromyces stipitatus (strain ATCC 10500 / CBS 375.48 / QM 6759 / NRRL 1006) TaxID=441959 RepID=B8MHD7_TALSN|nr:calmodulin, putative [Talaromyces stipitatus ATCC 10500]EED17116.1 calmodulin, putative [Talaromyces stipitatus ATCC 10500]
MNSNLPYKPSPLSFNSPRASPFRRPSSPGSPTTAIRSSTPPANSPGRGHTPVTSPSKLNQSYTVGDNDEALTEDDQPVSPAKSPRWREPPVSPTKGAAAAARNSFSSQISARSLRLNIVGNDTLSKLPASQVRDMREAFQVLDRDNDGSVNRDDVADVLSNLGQDPSSTATAQYFPAGAAQTMNLPTFLNTLSGLLAPLSSQKELLNAFAAFDDDDSGQVDVAELRDALLHTNPDIGESPLTEREVDEVLSGFTGRRAFGGRAKQAFSGQKRGDVFYYEDFVGSIMGSSDNGNGSNSAAKPPPAT